MSLDQNDATSEFEASVHQDDKSVLEQKQQILNSSGVLAAYEYFLVKICQEGIPKCNIYEYAAQTVLKFEQKKQAEKYKQQTTARSLATMKLNERLKAAVKEKSKSPEKNAKNQDKKINNVQK